MQVTKIFGLYDWEIHSVNELLESWVPSNTQRMILSLVVEISKSETLE